MRKTMRARTFPILLTLMMVFALLQGFTQTAFAASSGATIDVSDSATASGTNWTYDTSTKTFTVTGDVTITGDTGAAASSNGNRVVVAPGTVANITLDGVNIDVSATSQACAFDMTGATVNLTLVGENALKSGSSRAGLQAPDGSVLIINAANDTTDKLTATGGSMGAGIGGRSGGAGGNITINGGNITATGGDNAAGIGGGVNCAGGNITINGGMVTANGSYGAGIGGGFNGAGGNITINGGTVIANGGDNGPGGGAGIGGGGYGGAGGNIVITGGMITANGGNTTSNNGGGAGIGGGGGDSSSSGGSSGTITITSGAAIIAAGGASTNHGGGAGIGSGGSYSNKAIGSVGGIIIETGSSVAATGGIGFNGISNGANIGYGGSYNNANTGVEVTPTTDVTTHTVTVTQTTGGTIAAFPDASATTVVSGANQTYKITPEAGYKIVSVTVDGVNVGAVPCVTLTNIITDTRTITAHMVRIDTIDVGDSNKTSGEGWTYDAATKTFTVTGDVTIAGTTTANKIVVAPGTVANITLDGVNIDVSATTNACAFDMTGATVNLTLSGTNALKSGSSRAGLQAPSGSVLIINAADDTTDKLTATGGQYAAGIGGGSGGGNGGTGGNITINGGIITANGGISGAGIGGGNGCAGGNVTINGGTVTATSGELGAGIGGGRNGAGGNITIGGGVITANGRETGAGIGGGGNGGGGNIVITGGNVTATGGSNNYGGGAGIGGGGGSGISAFVGGSSGTITITSGATIKATGGSSGSNGGGAGIGSGGSYASFAIGAVDGIIIESGSSVTAIGGIGTNGSRNGANIGYGGGNGSVSGNANAGKEFPYGITVTYHTVTVTQTAGGTIEAFPVANATTVVNGANQTYKITPDAGYKIVSVTVDGVNVGAVPCVTLTNIITDTRTITATFAPASGGNIINLSDTNPPSSGDGWTYATNVYTVATGANVIVTGTSASDRRIVVSNSAVATITLDGADIGKTTALGSDQAAILLGTDAKVTLVLTNASFLTGNYRAGIQTTNATLTISGSGSLTAQGGNSSAGIGGRSGDAGGTVNIVSGTVTAVGGGTGAGIGGGNNGAGGNITINGGRVTATGGNGNGGAGIGGGGSGGGNGGAGGSVTINGGTVTATGSDGAGIGGGSGGSVNGGAGGSVTINGGTVTARSNNGGAGIGGGFSSFGTGGAGGTVNISGGTVTATSPGIGASIGGGGSESSGSGGGAGGDVTISGGTVTATSVGIGGAGGTVNISGGTVTATSPGIGASIGGGGSESSGSGGGAGGDVTISGGTVTATSVGIGGGYRAGGGAAAGGTVKITGGSVNGDIQSQPTSDGAIPVYLNTWYNASALNSAAITDIFGVTYGITDVKAAANGRLYFWLPETTASELIAVSADGTSYYGANYAREDNNSKQQELQLLVAPTITTTSLPGGTIGTLYSETLVATGFTPIAWSVTVGSLPGGLSLNAATGEISGAPTAAGTFNFTVQAANGVLPNATQALSIVVGKAEQAALSITGLGSDYLYGAAAFELSTEGGSGGGDVTYTSSNSEVASVLNNAPPDGKATVTIHKAGSFTITATKAADTTYNEATATGSASVSAATPNVSLTHDSAAAGESFALTATVAKVGTGSIPQGTVQFYDGATPLGTVTLDASGVATHTINPLDGVNHDYSAVYSGETDQYTTASGAVSYSAGKTAQTGFAIDDPGTLTYGGAGFALSASGGQSGGGVSFSVPAGNGILSVAADGTATIVGAGTVTVTAVKAGNDTYNAAEATRLVTVSQRDIASVTVTVLGSPHIFAGSQLQPTFNVVDGAIAINAGDYTNVYGANLNAGTSAGSITLTGQGNYTGTKMVTFDISPAVVNIAALLGVTAPVRGAAPVAAVIETAQYTGAVMWTPAVSGTFAAGTVYTAEITLTAKANYTLAGVTADYFTVAGATTVTNAADSGTVTAVFPATDAVPPTIVTTSLPNGTAGTTYSQTLTGTGTNPIAWRIDSGNLPGGLTLNTDGIITGNPTAAGTATFVVRATNSGGNDTQTLSITIDPAPVDKTADPAPVDKTADPAPVDRSALNAALTTANNIVHGGVNTTQAWTDFVNARMAADDILNRTSPPATQAEIDTATANLSAAISALKAADDSFGFENGVNRYTIGSGVNLAHSIARDWSLHTGLVYVDGQRVTHGTHYTSAAGSTRTTLHASYLDTLSVGQHTLTVEFSQGIAPIVDTFYVAAAVPAGEGGGGGAPATGDDRNPLLLLTICGGALAGLIGLIVWRKRQRMAANK